MSSQTKATSAVNPAAATSGTPIPGYIRARKPVDFGASNCFDLEESVSRVALEKLGPGTIKAVPVFLFDPCQNTISPIKTQTIIPNGAAITSFTGALAYAGVFLARGARIPDGNNTGGTNFVVLQDASTYQNRSVSAANATQSFTIDCPSIAKSLAINLAASAGAPTLAVLGSVDNSTFITIDTGLAAGPKQYVEGTVGATTALSPLSFRFIQINATSAGVGNTTTLTIAMK